MIGAYQQCPSHIGARTRLGGNPAQRVMPASPRRMADREDCVRYLECLDTARRSPHAEHVCAYPCGRYEHHDLHVGEAQKSNWTIEGV